MGHAPLSPGAGGSPIPAATLRRRPRHATTADNHRPTPTPLAIPSPRSSSVSDLLSLLPPSAWEDAALSWPWGHAASSSSAAHADRRRPHHPASVRRTSPARPDPSASLRWRKYRRRQG